jgi:hypothetical protein
VDGAEPLHRSARPNQGVFKINGLPPGRYLAAAIDYLEAGAARDPAVLERLRSAAVPVTLGEGESTTIALKVIAQ